MKLIFSIFLFFILSCQTTTIKNNNNGKENNVSVGWLDSDTYTVQVVGSDEVVAVDKAKHKILKDIVNVRVLNGSKYTDITKIKNEFEQPLLKGKIIKKRKHPKGLEIYFQIYGKGLKKKFERQ